MALMAQNVTIPEGRLDAIEDAFSTVLVSTFVHWSFDSQEPEEDTAPHARWLPRRSGKILG